MSNQKAFTLLEALFAYFFCLYFLYVLSITLVLFNEASIRFFNTIKRQLA